MFISLVQALTKRAETDRLRKKTVGMSGENPKVDRWENKNVGYYAVPQKKYNTKLNVFRKKKKTN